MATIPTVSSLPQLRGFPRRFEPQRKTGRQRAKSENETKLINHLFSGAGVPLRTRENSFSVIELRLCRTRSNQLVLKASLDFAGRPIGTRRAGERRGPEGAARTFRGRRSIFTQVRAIVRSAPTLSVVAFH